MKCSFQTKEGTCESYAMKSSNYCFTHNPDAKERHLEAASKGGAVSRDLGSISLTKVPLKQITHVIDLLEDTINKVRVVKEDATMDIRVANCVGYLAGQLMKAIELSDLESRLEVVERIIFERKSLTKKSR